MMKEKSKIKKIAQQLLNQRVRDTIKGKQCKVKMSQKYLGKTSKQNRFQIVHRSITLAKKTQAQLSPVTLQDQGKRGFAQQTVASLAKAREVMAKKRTLLRGLVVSSDVRATINLFVRCMLSLSLTRRQLSNQSLYCRSFNRSLGMPAKVQLRASACYAQHAQGSLGFAWHPLSCSTLLFKYIHYNKCK